MPPPRRERARVTAGTTTDGGVPAKTGSRWKYDAPRRMPGGYEQDAGIRCDEGPAGTNMAPPCGRATRSRGAKRVRDGRLDTALRQDMHLRARSAAAPVSKNPPEGQRIIIIANHCPAFITKRDGPCRIHRLPEQYGQGQSGSCGGELACLVHRIFASRMPRRRISVGAIAVATRAASPAPCKASLHGFRAWRMRYRPI